MRVASDLAAVMVPIGYVGAALAVICAVVAAVAIIRGSGGLSGGAVGVWIVFALMSFTASFANQWMPLILACAALAAMLVIGGVVRAIVSAAGVGRPERAAADDLPKAVPASKATVAPKATVASAVRSARATKAAATASIAIVP
jgi:hypothetical protein